MSTSSASSLLYVGGSLLAGFGLAWLLGLTTCDDKAGAKPLPEFVAVYDAKQLAELMGSPGAEGVRFYLAKAEDGRATAVAGAVDPDGAHVRDSDGIARFRMFKAISDASTDMAVLEEADARDAVRRAHSDAKPVWSIDALNSALRAVLGTSGCNAIGIVERGTTEDAWTFDLVPLKLEKGAVTVLGELKAMRVGGPCPVHCPRAPEHYLHR